MWWGRGSCGREVRGKWLTGVGCWMLLDVGCIVMIRETGAGEGNKKGCVLNGRSREGGLLAERASQRS